MATKPPAGKTWRERIPWPWIVLAVSGAFPFVAMRFMPVAAIVVWLDEMVQRLGPFGMVVFTLIYVVDALLFGPAWLFALVAGLAFGLGPGMAVIWVAAMIGAAVAFLIARYVARHRVEKLARKNDRFEAVDRAIAKNGWKVVLLLRISPILPYTVSNYLYGLTAIRFWPYFLASGAGMLPMIAVFVSVGAAGREAALAAAAGERARTPLEWAVLAAGVAVTVAAAILIARAARGELEKLRLEKELRDRRTGIVE